MHTCDDCVIGVINLEEISRLSDRAGCYANETMQSMQP